MLYANQIWGRPVTWPKFYRPKIGRKLTSLNRYTSVIINIDENGLGFLSKLSTAFLLVMFIYPNLNTIFLVFSFFLLFFFFFIIVLRLSTFKPLYALHSKFERLKISGRASARLKLEVLGWGNPPQTGPPKFWTFKSLELNESNFRNW